MIMNSMAVSSLRESHIGIEARMMASAVALVGTVARGVVDPPLGRVGMIESQARATGRPLLGAQRPMSRVGRAIEKDETQGLMKVTVDAETHKIMGAAFLGTGGDEAIHGIVDIMNAGAPYTVLQRDMPIHPTVSELIPTMLGELEPIR